MMSESVSAWRKAGFLVMGTSVLAASFLTASSAYAAGGTSSTAAVSPHAGGNCTAYREEKVVNNRPNDWRVRARCSSLNANSKARGVLDIPGDTDVSTSWFTVLNTNRYSGYKQSVFGDPTARSEVAPV